MEVTLKCSGCGDKWTTRYPQGAPLKPTGYTCSNCTEDGSSQTHYQRVGGGNGVTVGMTKLAPQKKG